MEHILKIISNYLDDGDDLLNIERALADNTGVFPGKPFTETLFTKRLVSNLKSLKGIELAPFLKALKESKAELSGSAVLSAVIPSINPGDYDIFVPFQTVRTEKYYTKVPNKTDIFKPQSLRFTPIEEYLWKCVGEDERKIKILGNPDSSSLRYEVAFDTGMDSVRTYNIHGTSFQVINIKPVKQESKLQPRSPLTATEIGQFIDKYFDFRCVKNRFDGNKLVIGYPESIMSKRLEIGPSFNTFKTPIFMAYRLMKYQQRGFQPTVSNEKDLPPVLSPLNHYHEPTEDKVVALKKHGVEVNFSHRAYFNNNNKLITDGYSVQIDWTKFNFVIDPLLV